MKLTTNDMRAVALLKDNGNTITCLPSEIGFLLYPSKSKTHGLKRSPQGMALCGSKVMRRLEKAGLVRITYHTNSHLNTYKLTADGTTTK